jgi:hypothetical protein
VLRGGYFRQDQYPAILTATSSQQERMIEKYVTILAAKKADPSATPRHWREMTG